jgi:hypothetical protein
MKEKDEKHPDPRSHHLILGKRMSYDSIIRLLRHIEMCLCVCEEISSVDFHQ